MGVLARRFEETRNLAGWLADDDDQLSGRMTSAGVRINATSALSLTTVWRCIDLLSSAISTSPKDVYLKIGDESYEEFGQPNWLTMPNPADANYTANDYFAQVAMSLLLDGNFFVHVFPYVLDPQVLTVLDPGRVDVKSGPLYDIRDAKGSVVRTVGPMEMLHGVWMRPPGSLRGISPLEAMRRTFGAQVAAEDHAARFFGQGASLSFGVEVPGAMDEPKKAEMARALKRKYAGLQNSHAIGVLTNGAKFVAGLAPTPEQAQMLETRKFGVEDTCRIYGVPPGMAGSQEPGASSYASDFVKDKQFAERAVLPLAVRIEKPHERLLSVPVNITDPSAKMQFKFNLDSIARVDILTRMQAYKEGVAAGVWQPAEARKKEDLPFVKGSDRLFMLQQMVPIEDLGLTLATETPETQTASATEVAADRKSVV